jgi:hypothetical protein
MGVASHKTVTVIDLDHLAIAITVPGPDHHARSHGDDVRTCPTREIDPLVKGSATGKRIGSRTEAGRNIACGHGSPFRKDLTA